MKLKAAGLALAAVPASAAAHGPDDTGGSPLVLASDRDSGLYIFRYDPAG